MCAIAFSIHNCRKMILGWCQNCDCDKPPRTAFLYVWYTANGVAIFVTVTDLGNVPLSSFYGKLQSQFSRWIDTVDRWIDRQIEK